MDNYSTMDWNLYSFAVIGVVCGVLSAVGVVSGQYSVAPATVEPNTVPEEWHLERLCGQTIFTYGGVLHFDSTKLRGSGCSVYITGLGPNDTMLSMFFVHLNVSADCPANVTLTEPRFQQSNDHIKGLSLSYCQPDPNLNPNSMFTTLSDKLLITYRRTDTKKFAGSNPPVVMEFTMKVAAFSSRYTGCTQKEIKESNMVSCDTGRCVNKHTLCKDLNPCGNMRDCFNSSAPRAGESQENHGMGFATVAIIIVAVVFGMFAAIQICLMLRNNERVCGWAGKRHRDTTRDGIEVQAEFIPRSQQNGQCKKEQGIEATFVPMEGAANDR